MLPGYWFIIPTLLTFTGIIAANGYPFRMKEIRLLTGIVEIQQQTHVTANLTPPYK